MVPTATMSGRVAGPWAAVAPVGALAVADVVVATKTSMTYWGFSVATDPPDSIG